jgi:hypothetical protein
MVTSLIYFFLYVCIVFLLLLDFVLCLVSNVTASVFSIVLLSVEYVAVAIRWIHYSSICGNAEVFLEEMPYG